jgi:hypothetical protein
MDTTTHIFLPPAETPRGSYIIDVSPALVSISERVLEFAEKTDFKQAEDYHVTVLSRHLSPLIEAAKATGEVDDIIDEITEWEATFRNKFYLMAKRDEEGAIKESIIQMIDMPSVGEFFEKLAKEKIIDAPVPPTHITLFTKYNDDGIGIYSQDEFDDYLIREIY